MSNYINWRMVIRRATDLSAHAKLIAFYLHTYMNDNHDFAFPSLTTICGECAISKPTAIKYLSELEMSGYLTRQKRFGNSVIYHATIPKGKMREVVNEIDHSSKRALPTVVNDVYPNNQMNNQLNNQEHTAHAPQKTRRSQRFQKPTVEDVAAYCRERQNSIDPQHFWDYYEARGWMLSKGVKMRSWRHAVSTWERNGPKGKQGTQSAASRFMENLRNA